MNLGFKYISQLNPESPRLLGAVCMAILLIILAAGLWPFNFFPRNKVAWLPDQNGVHFYEQGVIISSAVRDKEQKPPFPDGTITLELWLRPLMEKGNLPHILTLYDGKTPDIFLVGQWKSHLIIRSRTDDPAARKRGKPYQEIGIHNALLKNQDTLITITSGPEGSAIYVNGKLAQTYPRHRLLSGNRSGNVRLILGNSPTGESCWNGNLMGLAIYNRALSADQVSGDYRSWLGNDYAMIKRSDGLVGLYPFNERKGSMVHNEVNANDTLIIPGIFKPLQRKILYPFWLDFRWDLSFVQDVTINILGFIPFGFYFSALFLKTARQRRLSAYMITAILGMGLSLAIELSQAYLPTRDSSLADVASNFAGTILGIVIFQIFPQNPIPHRTRR
jgi:VanZ like family/Concanavalin A-like lectin/glucanases superfamily